MDDALKFTALVALLFLGAAGWGRVTIWIFERVGWHGARRDLGFPHQLLLGVSLSLAVGGYLVGVDAGDFGVLVAWQVLGAALALARAPRLWRRFRAAPAHTRALTLALGVTGGVLYVVATASAIAHPVYSSYDDDPAYIYLARRLATTGGLIDPFNFRRLTSYGGTTLYQSLFYRLTGVTSLRGYEFTFACLLLVVVAVGTVRRRWLVLGTLVVGLAVAQGVGVGPVVNLSPDFSVAALSLGIFQLLGKVRLERDGDPQHHLFVAIGLLAGGILAERFDFMVSMTFVIVVVVVVLRWGRCLVPLLTVGATVVVANLGWALALQRSSGTPLYPLLNGNADPTWPSSRNPDITSLGDRWHLFVQTFDGYGEGRMALLCVVLGLGFLVLSRRRPVRMLVLLVAGVGALVQLAVYTYEFAGLTLVGLGRYEAPTTLACALLAIDVFWPRYPDGAARPALGAAVARLTPAWPGARRAGAAVLTVLFVPAVVLLLFGDAPSAVATTARLYVRTGASDLRLGTDVLTGSTGFADRYATVRAEYARLDAIVPRGARVLAAVDEPALLDPERFTFATLDIAGAVSPPPHMPYFEGLGPKLRYLRRLGYGYIVTQSDTDFGEYRLQLYTQIDPRLSDYHDRAWGPYLIDWQRSVNVLEAQHPSWVRRVGSLALIRI
ncbi:MAG TPA: hypothetical protein VMB72_15570 [Acidimicrobiales bacterium]|nr:hypothetical protein [Acidimicrobiales bacterium]